MESALNVLFFNNLRQGLSQELEFHVVCSQNLCYVDERRRSVATYRELLNKRQTVKGRRTFASGRKTALYKSETILLDYSTRRQNSDITAGEQ